MAIVRAHSFRFDPGTEITIRQAEIALASIPPENGITGRRVFPFFLESSGSVVVTCEVLIADPVNETRIKLSRRLVETALRNATAEIPRQTGYDTGAPEELWRSELDRIKLPGGEASAWDTLLADMRGFGKGLTTALVAVAIVVGLMFVSNYATARA